MSNDPNAFDWLSSQMPAEPATDNHVMSEAAEEQQRLRMEFANLCKRCLYDGEGAALLQKLRDYTIEVPLLNVSASIVTSEVQMSPADWAYVREGQNSVIRFIEGQIHLARNPPQTEETLKEENDG